MVKGKKKMITFCYSFWLLIRDWVIPWDNETYLSHILRVVFAAFKREEAFNKWSANPVPKIVTQSSMPCYIDYQTKKGKV